MLNSPQLTFYCELPHQALTDLFADPSVAETLRQLGAAVSLGLLDLSQERAEVVRELNRTGIPVVAWLLLPEEQGYWFNLDNSAAALERYREFRVWTGAEQLRWAGIGLDIEPDIRLFANWRDNPWRTLAAALWRLGDRGRLARARGDYHQLIAAARQDGYRVDVYAFPLIADERRAGSTLLQRLSGLVDLEADREVWMLYTSQLRPYGTGLLGSYGPEAQSIAVGVTGGGVDTGVVDARPLSWSEFARDLLMARQSTEDIHIFSLEGCIEQGFLGRLVDFDWADALDAPVEAERQIDRLRRILRAGLAASRWAWALALGAGGALVLARIQSKRRG